MNTSGQNTGPLGQPRGIGFAILMTIITIGIYSLYWVFLKIHKWFDLILPLGPCLSLRYYELIPGSICKLWNIV